MPEPYWDRRRREREEKKTMHQTYGEPNDKFGKHEVCVKCGLCKTCRDCKCKVKKK